MRYLEESDSQRQKVEWWLTGPGGRGDKELVFNEYRVKSLGRGKQCW